MLFLAVFLSGLLVLDRMNCSCAALFVRKIDLLVVAFDVDLPFVTRPKARPGITQRYSVFPRSESFEFVFAGGVGGG